MPVATPGPPIYMPLVGVPTVVPEIDNAVPMICWKFEVYVLPLMACPTATVPVTVPPTVNVVDEILLAVEVNAVVPVMNVGVL